MISILAKINADDILTLIESLTEKTVGVKVKRNHQGSYGVGHGYDASWNEENFPLPDSFLTVAEFNDRTGCYTMEASETFYNKIHKKYVEAYGDFFTLKDSAEEFLNTIIGAITGYVYKKTFVALRFCPPVFIEDRNSEETKKIKANSKRIKIILEDEDDKYHFHLYVVFYKNHVFYDRI